MRTTTVTLAATIIALAAMSLTGAVGAETGAGACVAGQGFSLYEASLSGPYVGVNVGFTNSTTGVFTERATYEAECCAEGHQAPDCFRPAA